MTAIRAISSMATRQVLAELCAMVRQSTDVQVDVESVGGVDAARRVQEGEAFDLVFLASDAIQQLEASGRVLAGSRVDIVRSHVGVAVKAGSPVPDLAGEEAVKRAILAAPAIGYSTGPSGNALMKLFERWGIAGEVKDKLVQATPGIPVATLVAEGRASLGFQQMSELVHVEGITLAGPLPGEIRIVTIFSGAVGAHASNAGAAGEVLRFMASPQTADAKQRHGMQPA